MRFPAVSLPDEGLAGHRGRRRAWAKATGGKAIIVGDGRHGLARAFYLVKCHGLTRVAVLERGWIGGGAAGRHMTALLL